MTGDAPILLFDGVCHLCDGAVRFILRRDPRGVFRFAALQSEAGRRLAAEHGVPAEALDTVILIEGGRAYERSEAALRVVRHLRFPWPAMGVFRVIPRGWRDRLYDAVARRRYRWFGRRETCAVPDPAVRDRFLI